MGCAAPLRRETHRTVSYGGGTFKVWCANRDGTTPWTNTGTNNGRLLVYSEGNFDGAARQFLKTFNFGLSGTLLRGPLARWAEQ